MGISIPCPKCGFGMIADEDDFKLEFNDGDETGYACCESATLFCEECDQDFTYRVLTCLHRSPKESGAIAQIKDNT